MTAVKRIVAWDLGLVVVLRDSLALVIASAPASAIGGMADVSLALSCLEPAAQTRGISTCRDGIIHMGLQSNQGIPGEDHGNERFWIIANRLTPITDLIIICQLIKMF